MMKLDKSIFINWVGLSCDEGQADITQVETNCFRWKFEINSLKLRVKIGWLKPKVEKDQKSRWVKGRDELKIKMGWRLRQTKSRWAKGQDKPKIKMGWRLRWVKNGLKVKTSQKSRWDEGRERSSRVKGWLRLT